MCQRAQYSKPIRYFVVIRRFDGFLPRNENFVELLDCGSPLLGVEAVEGLVVVAVVFWRRFTRELGEFLLIPEDEVVGKLADRVVAAAVGPLGLFRREIFYGNIGRNKPILLVVRGPQLFQQNALQRGWLLGLPISIQ